MSDKSNTSNRIQSEEQEGKTQQGSPGGQHSQRTNSEGKSSDDRFTRRELMIGGSGIAVVGGGYLFLRDNGGQDFYEDDASDYIISVQEIGRIVGEDLGASTNDLGNVDGVDTGISYEFADRFNQADPLEGYTLIVSESIEDAEDFYEAITDRSGSVTEADFGDEAQSVSMMGSTALTFRLANIVVDIPGTDAVEYLELERLAEEQISQIT